MKKTELAKILKPLVKQCIKEVLLEEGILSNIVSEVVIGVNKGVQGQTITEQTVPPQPSNQRPDVESERRKQKINETRKQLRKAYRLWKESPQDLKKKGQLGHQYIVENMLNKIQEENKCLTIEDHLY